MENIVIAGAKIQLDKPTPDILRELWLGLIAEFDVFQFEMGGRQLLLLVAKDSVSYSPMRRGKIAQKIEETIKLPVVFYFDKLPTYERDRLVGKGVYFVVGEKFAYVPTLLANRRLSTVDMPMYFFPSTQYLLLFHLQGRSLDGLTLKEIAEITPYKYPTIASSIRQLESLGFARLTTDSGRTKRLGFLYSDRELWEKSQHYRISPIKRVGYASEPIEIGLTGGIEALSHYSMLVGEECPTRVLTVDEINELRHELTPLEDIQRVEIWKYPPIAEDGYVDRLSLYLTLSADPDPRVEKELETMINSMPW